MLFDPRLLHGQRTQAQVAEAVRGNLPSTRFKAFWDSWLHVEINARCEHVRFDCGGDQMSLLRMLCGYAVQEHLRLPCLLLETLHNRIQTASVFGKQGMGHHIAETVIASFLPTGRTVESAGRETLFVPQVLTSSAVQ